MSRILVKQTSASQGHDSSLEGKVSLVSLMPSSRQGDLWNCIICLPYAMLNFKYWGEYKHFNSLSTPTTKTENRLGMQRSCSRPFHYINLYFCRVTQWAGWMLGIYAESGAWTWSQLKLPKRIEWSKTWWSNTTSMTSGHPDVCAIFTDVISLICNLGILMVRAEIHQTLPLKFSRLAEFFLLKKY